MSAAPVTVSVEVLGCGCTLATATLSDGSTALGLDPVAGCRAHDEEPPEPEPELDPFTEWMREEVRRVALAGVALEDMLLVPVLAATPWFLHWLAAQPEWSAYAETVRA